MLKRRRVKRSRECALKYCCAMFRSLGDGQVDFRRIFTLLTEAGYRGWAVLEWECAVKSPEQGARTSVYLASSPEVANVSGKYLTRRLSGGTTRPTL